MSNKIERNATRHWRPALMSVEDVAYELRCSPTYVRELQKQGHLPARKLGKLTVWELAVVDRFIATLPLEQPDPGALQVGVRRSNAGRPPNSSRQ